MGENLDGVSGKRMGENLDGVSGKRMGENLDRVSGKRMGEEGEIVSLHSLQDCKLCELWKEKSNVYSPPFGKLGLNHKFMGGGKRILMIGMAPSNAKDSMKMLAFEGSTTGDFLWECAARAGLGDCDVYVTNLLKCSEVENQFPTQSHVNACWYWLEKELELVNPKLVVCFSKRVHEIVKKKLLFYTFSRGLKIVVMRHPSYYFRRRDSEGLVKELDFVCGL